MKKVERGVLYFAGIEAKVVDVCPADGKKFTIEELQAAVGGYTEPVVPAVPYTNVFVNEEGSLRSLPSNLNTWLFARRSVYAMNGYPPYYTMRGNAISIRKAFPGEKLSTIAEALR